MGWGYDDTLLAEARHPTRADLDRVSTRHPVWIVHVSGHLGVANSRALEIAGVTKSTAQPRGGRIRLDPQTSEPNGVFEEAGALVGIHIPGYTPEQRQAAPFGPFKQSLRGRSPRLAISGKMGIVSA